jgi:hypothetical protein
MNNEIEIEKCDDSHFIEKYELEKSPEIEKTVSENVESKILDNTFINQIKTSVQKENATPYAKRLQKLAGI